MKGFARFLWDFVIGDDPVIAAGVVIALAVTALLAGSSVAAWWLMPVAVAALLTLSVWRASRPRSESGPTASVAAERVEGEREAVLSSRPRM